MPLRDTPLFRREEQLDDCHLTWLGTLPAFVSGRRFAFDLSAILSRTTLQAIPAFCACVYRTHKTSLLLDLIVQGVGWRGVRTMSRSRSGSRGVTEIYRFVLRRCL